MSDTGRIRRWVVLPLVSGLMLVFIGASLWFAATRLDIADQWGSVAGGLAAILGLPLTVYGIVSARNSGGSPPGSGPAVGEQHNYRGENVYVSHRDMHVGRDRR